MADLKIMRSSRYAKAVFGTLFGVTGLIPTARADFYLHHWENQREPHEQVRLDLDVGSYSSNTNFDSTNRAYYPIDLTRYSRIQSDLLAAGGFTEKLTLYGRVSWARIQLEHATRSGTSYGFTDQTIGANVRIWEAREAGRAWGPAIDLQVQGDFPGYNNNTSTAKGMPYLGDGSMDYTGGGFFSTPVLQRAKHRIFAVAGAGFTFRNAGFSSSVPWTAQARYSSPGALMNGTLYADAALHGIFSLKSDSDTGKADAALAGRYVGSGGSYITNALNPSLVHFRGKVGFRTATELDFSFAVDNTLTGQNAPRGTYFLFSFETRFTTSPKGILTDPARQTTQEYSRSNKGFVSYYNLEAQVLRSNDRMNLVKINKGSQDTVSVGDVFDFFQPRSDGTLGSAIARGQVTDVRAGEAVLKINEFFKEVWIDEGFLARRPIQ